MAVINDLRKLPVYQKLADHLRNPLYRNGYYLTMNSLTTSGIGLIYWILAAHYYSAHDVGINSAVIAIMTFLAGASELNLMSVLIRFIPTAGRSTRRMVIYSYLVSLAISAVVSIVFLLMVNFWAPALKFLAASPILEVWFVVTNMAWCIFVLQDSVLTGLRQTIWVPIENAVYSVVKIILMVAFSLSFTILGIFASWSIGLLFSIIPTNYLIFRRLISNHEKREPDIREPITPRQLVRFAAPDYLGALFWLVATTLMPVIVTSVAGATANAHFYLAWTITNAFHLISIAMGSSLVVEASRDQSKLGKYSYNTFKSTVKIIVPAVLLVVVAAPYILMIYGKGYSAASTSLLRLLAISAVPNIFTTLFVSISRVQRRTEAVVAVLGSFSTMLIALTYLFLKTIGIDGVGYAWLISQMSVAIVAYFTKLRPLWRNASLPAVKQKEPHFGQSGFSGVVNPLYHTAQKMMIIPYLNRVHQGWKKQVAHRKIVEILPEILGSIPTNFYDPEQQNWTIYSVAHNGTNTSVAYLGSQGGQVEAVLKLTNSRKEAENLHKQYKNIAYLEHLALLGEWRELLPSIVYNGKVRDHEYFIETVLPGIPMQKLLADQEMRRKAMLLSACEISTLHKKTANVTIISTKLFDQWTHDAFESILSLISGGAIPPKHENTVNKLRTQLYEDLFGKMVGLSWIHGDYFPSNILVAPGGDKITGIVDWDLARPNELPVLDLLHLIISIRMQSEQQEMGQVVSSLLQNPDWKPEELQLVQSAQPSNANSISLSTLVILAWLRHINANLNKTDRFAHHSLWIDENVTRVLALK